jgi:fructose-1,6-bisphosphatase/inositol monophosphatase family enzyme
VSELTFDGYAVAALIATVGRDLQTFRQHDRVRIVQSGPDGPVTTADLRAQERLISGLASRFGPATFVAEEGAHRHTKLGPGSTAWIIDPLDGTSEYLAGGRQFGVQVAALSAGRLVGAWICCPDLGWALSAWAGGPLHVNVPDTIDNSDGRTVIADGDFEQGHLDALRERGVTGYRRSRSCAVEYCQIVTDQLDVALYRRTHPWDHAPGAYLAYRAGAQSIRWNGNKYHPADNGLGILTVAAQLDAAEIRRRLIP